MIVAVFIAFNHIDEQPRKVVCVSGRANLVVYDAHSVVRFADVEHCLYKIFAVDAEHPRYAHDEIFFEQLRDGELTFKLSLPVHVERLIILTIWLPRFGSLTVEHVVCRDINHFTPEFFAYFGDISRSARIYCAHLWDILLIFRHVDSRPRRAMHDRVGLDFGHYRIDFFRIGYIHFRDIHADRHMSAFFKFVYDIKPELSLNTCHQNFHINTITIN